MMQAMVQALIGRLPYELRMTAQSEIEMQWREIAFLHNRFPDRYAWIRDIETVQLLAALGVFYRRVLGPLDGGQRFVLTVSRQGGAAVVFGRERFRPNDFENVQRAARAFQRILAAYSIPLALLGIAQTEDFLFAAKRLWQELENG